MSLALEQTPPPLTDRMDPMAPLARAAIQGKPEATRALLRALGPGVLAVIQTILGRSNPDVDDVAQEAFVAILRALPTFRYESSVAHFAKQVALRRASNALRDRQAARRAASATVALDEKANLESTSASPLDATVSARRMALLREIVGELPQEQADTLLLRVLFGHSVEEIAEETRAPINTVRSRLRNARAALRERIAGDARLAELMEKHASDEEES
jgi:RNA polymerase sigma-70 factor (ECF subfamily)